MVKSCASGNNYYVSGLRKERVHRQRAFEDHSALICKKEIRCVIKVLKIFLCIDSSNVIINNILVVNLFSSNVLTK